MSRQVMHHVEEDAYAWLKQLADADNVGVGEIVRRCIHFCMQSQEEPAEPSRAEFEAEWARAEAMKREAERKALIAAKQAELEALLRGEPTEQYTEPVRRETSVLDEDYSNEPRAEEIEIPLDPDDVGGPVPPQTRPVVRSNAPAASLFETTAMTPPSGMRPGTATRPAPPNRDLGNGLKMGDALGNIKVTYTAGWMPVQDHHRQAVCEWVNVIRRGPGMLTQNYDYYSYTLDPAADRDNSLGGVRQLLGDVKKWVW